MPYPTPHRSRLGILAGSIVLGLVAPGTTVHAACTHVCREQVAACVRTDCAGLDREARHGCEETCRGRLGCPAPIRTLAYVVTHCHLNAGGRLVGSQELVVRRRSCDPVTVKRFTSPAPVADPLGLCALVGDNREGFGSVLGGVFQRIGVAPDGSHVVFEVTNRFQLGARTPLSPEDEGFFVVRADGGGLRRLGPASRDPGFVVYLTAEGEPSASFESYLAFAPSGRRVTYTDMGPGPTGEEMAQVFTLDVATGRRTQVTRVPGPLISLPPGRRSLTNPAFLDEHTIVFYSPQLLGFAPPAELGGERDLFAIRTDGSRLRQVPPPRALANTPYVSVAPRLGVMQPGGRDVTLNLPGTPANQTSDPARTTIREVFFTKGRTLVQLTDFHRVDTDGVGKTVAFSLGSAARKQRVLLLASADPLGANPSQNCQLFSVDVLGEDLRQLTHFSEAALSANGCDFTSPPGCAFHEVYQDPLTGEVVFYSNCSPFEPGFRGSQIFAMRPDGTGLRQLTHTTGATVGADGFVDVEIPGPIAYSAPLR